MEPKIANVPEGEVVEQDRVDEKLCGERIEYALRKYGCMLEGTAIIKNGFTQIQIGVAKIPADVRKKIKEAEREQEKTTSFTVPEA